MRCSWLKKTGFWGLLAVALSACNQPAAITGTLTDENLETTTVYLIKPPTLRSVAAAYFGKVIDSAIVAKDGSFAFSNLPQTTEPILLELAVKVPGMASNFLETDNPTKANYMPIVWQTGEQLRITANAASFQQSFALKAPTAKNHALLELRDIHQQAYQTFLANKPWQVKDGSALMAKEEAHLNFQHELIGFASTTNHLLPALVAVRWASPEGVYERIPEFLVNQCAKWSAVEPAHPWVKELCNEADPANLPVLLGDVFPDLTLPLLAGDTVSLHENLGAKLTIIDLWASWCAPCRKENRNVLVPLWDACHEQGVQIIAYGLESDRDAWQAAVERDGADRWLQASDLQGDAPPFLKRIRVRTIPANFILDEQGVVVAKNLHGEALEDFVRDYLDSQ
jgi:thiol-disulfide isomerase/thioredoxin